MILSQQKASIYRDITELKQREYRNKTSCRCKGFCRINHSRYSWTKQNSDFLMELLRKIENNKENGNNDDPEHPQQKNSEFICQHCDSMFEDVSSLRSHIDNHHDPYSGMICEQCEQIFTNKRNMTVHTEYHHS